MLEHIRMPPHETKIRVRYGETDQAGVVYYGNYLLYFEVARSELMRSLGMPYTSFEGRGQFLTVADAYCKYLGTASYDDLLIVRTTVTRMTLTRVVFHYDVVHNDSGEIIATGDTTLACIDEGRKPSRLPDDLKELLMRGEGVAGRQGDKVTR